MPSWLDHATCLSQWKLQTDICHIWARFDEPLCGLSTLIFFFWYETSTYPAENCLASLKFRMKMEGAEPLPVVLDKSMTDASSFAFWNTGIRRLSATMGPLTLRWLIHLLNETYGKPLICLLQDYCLICYRLKPLPVFRSAWQPSSDCNSFRT